MITFSVLFSFTIFINFNELKLVMVFSDTDISTRVKCGVISVIAIPLALENANLLQR